MANTIKDSIQTRKIAFLVADGVDTAVMLPLKKSLESQGAVVELIAPKLGSIKAKDKTSFEIKKSFRTAASVFYDAVYVPGGSSVTILSKEPDAIHFANEAWKHCKPVAADSSAGNFLSETYFADAASGQESEALGILMGDTGNILAKQFSKAIAQHRFWDRELQRKVPA